MDDLLKSIFAAALTSVSVFAVLAFLGKNYATELLKSLFAQQLESQKHEHQKEIENLKVLLNTAQHARTRVSDDQVEAFRLLSDLVYRCRNIARDLLHSSEARRSRAVVDEFGQLVDALVETVFRFRLVYDDSLFDMLHKFKDDAKTFEMASELIANEVVDESQVLEGMTAIFDRMDSQYPALIEEFRGRLHIDSEPPGSGSLTKA